MLYCCSEEKGPFGYPETGRIGRILRIEKGQREKKNYRQKYERGQDIKYKGHTITHQEKGDPQRRKHCRSRTATHTAADIKFKGLLGTEQSTLYSRNAIEESFSTGLLHATTTSLATLRLLLLLLLIDFLLPPPFL